MADQNSKIQLEGRVTTMNAVLISIRPKWCQRIIGGEKTIEVRKTRPKIKTPFRGHIYCTRGGQDLNIPISQETLMHDWLETGSMRSLNCPRGNGKVIGEFTCDEIFCVPEGGVIPSFLLRDACLTANEIYDYLGEKAGFFWHMSDLEIYDVPLELEDLTGIRTLRNGMGFELWKLDRAPQDWCYLVGGNE